MLSDHGANPIFFNKKHKDWTSRTLANPPSLMFNNTTHTPPQYRLHMCITPKRVHTKVIDLIIQFVVSNF